MAKRHLEQYDSEGHLLEIYLNDDEVMVGDKTLEEKLGEMDEEIGNAGDGTVKSVTLNGTKAEPDENGDVELELEVPEQVQADWEEDDSSDPAYIKHKPTVDDVLDEDSENAIANKTVTAAIAQLRTAIESVIGEGSTKAIENFQEVLDFLENVKDEETLIGLLTTLQTAINGKLDKTDVYNGLDRTTEGKALDARQGKALNDLITALQSGKSDKNATVSGVTYDTTSHKLKQTINGTTSDVANVDTAPTANSDNFVTSGGVSTALATLLSNIHIGTNGNWWIGPETDPNNDTGIKAQGPQGAQGNVQVDGDGNVLIVNNLTEGGEGAALSAEQGKRLKETIDNLPIVDDVSGNDGQTVLAPASARMVKEIYNNLRELYTNLAGIAFIDDKPTWQSVEKRKYDLTTSLTACNASVTTGDAGSGKVYEGRVVVRLTPTTNYQFSNIALTKNGDAVTFERTNNQDGSVDIAFTATGDIALSATAVDGFLISLVDSPNVDITQSHSGSTYTAVLDPHAHYSLPAEIEVKKGDTTLVSGTDYTYTQGNGTVVITNVDANITIKAIAAEDAHATISLASGVSNVVGKHNNAAVTFPLKVYADMLSNGEYDIVFSAADGCKFTTNPNVGGTDLTNNTLTVTSTNVTNEASIEVSAAARPLETFNVSVSVDGHITKDNGTDNGQIPSTIQEDSALTIRLKPDTDYRITIGTNTMGVETLTPTESGGVYIFSIAAVTGNIVISATSAEVVAHPVETKFVNMTSDGAAQAVEGEDYTANIAPTTGATSNGDLRVYIGHVLKTAGDDADYTFSNGLLTIPAAKVTGDIVIIATASTGVFQATANVSGATLTITLDGGTSTTVTCDTSDGNGGYVGTANNIHNITALTYTASEITKMDFGGALFTGSLNDKFRNTTIKSVKGLVLKPTGQNYGYAFYNASNLTELETTGWDLSGASSNAGNAIFMTGCGTTGHVDAYGWGKHKFAGCKMSSIDVRGWNMSAETTIADLFDGCSNLASLDISTWKTTTSLTNVNSFGSNTSNQLIAVTIGDFNTNCDVSNWASYSRFMTYVRIVICTSSTPPTMNVTNNLCWLDKCLIQNGSPALTAIYVPDSAVNAYKGAAGWSKYESIIKSINEYNH